MCGLLVCTALARYDRGTYEVAATLLWTGLLVETAWRPLRDTSGLAIIHHSKRRMRILCAQPAARIPYPLSPHPV